MLVPWGGGRVHVSLGCKGIPFHRGGLLTVKGLLRGAVNSERPSEGGC